MEFHYRINGMKVILSYQSIKDCTLIKPNIKKDGLDYISNHLKFLKHDIHNINQLGSTGIVCDITRNIILPTEMNGINSNIQKIPSLIEWLVIFSQMAQVVAYNFDFMERSESQTLWMKYVKAEMKDFPVTSLHDRQFMAWGEIDQAKLLKIKNQSWRTFNLFGEVFDHNVTFIGKIAHQLPQNKTILGGQNYAR